MGGQWSGSLRKMTAKLADPIEYSLQIGEESVPLNGLIGQRVRLRQCGPIRCIRCGSETRSSFNQGYCHSCFRSAAACDRCVMSPELCHYHEGTCREPDWGERNCMQPHFVYLANSSGAKVGITRAGQIPIRWIDQGAVQAVTMMRVATRQQAGLAEVIFKQEVSDRTQWQRMLKSEGEELDLAALRATLLDRLEPELAALQARFGVQAVHFEEETQPWALHYPVAQYPAKVISHNLDRDPCLEGMLCGIKGQYLILDSKVINLRKYTAYDVEFSV